MTALVEWEAWERGLAAELDRDAHQGARGAGESALKFRREAGLWVAELVIDELPGGKHGRWRAEGRGLGMREATSMAALEIYRKEAFRSSRRRARPELEAWEAAAPGRRQHVGSNYEETEYQVSLYPEDGSSVTVSGLDLDALCQQALERAHALGFRS